MRLIVIAGLVAGALLGLLASTAAAYTNPVNSATFPDPMVVRDGETYWAYATGPRFPMMKSQDLVTWESAGTALSARPAWAIDATEWHPWAPSVIRRSEACPGATTPGCHLMFYSALSDAFGPRTNCMAVATSSTPAGPFNDQGILRDGNGAKVGCGDGLGYGNIDAHPFVDGDRTYLYVSTDFSCTSGGCALKPTMSVIPFDLRTLRATGSRTPLFSAVANTWEQAPWAPVVENPWVVKRGGVYHLMFSGGGWNEAYGMGHATATSPTGPFTRSSDNPTTTAIETVPFLEQTSTVRGPGGGSLIADAAGKEWLIYHGRADGSDRRTLRLDPFSWDDERPAVAGPTSTATSVNPATGPVPGGTPDALTLTAHGYKVKGLQRVDLAWNRSTEVDVFRSGARIASVTGDKYTDAMSSKGGGTYRYRVCTKPTSTTPSSCSAEATVVF
jgi:beta-xylosidase